MSLYRVRPLGCRENLVAFELYRGVGRSEGEARDIRAEFTLRDPQGRPHRPYPEIEVERPITGREMMALQAEAWAKHSAQTRQLYGSRPLAGAQPPHVPVRGVLAFPVEVWDTRGRWTLARREAFWYFSAEQIRQGMPRLLPPARGT